MKNQRTLCVTSGVGSRRMFDGIEYECVAEHMPPDSFAYYYQSSVASMIVQVEGDPARWELVCNAAVLSGANVKGAK